MNNLIYIPVEKIKPHPLNPRKDLGDLTELTESIKAKGIMQNLTVVPRGEEYTAVIGHRRLAAAKAAGLTEVPCVIADLTEKEQLQTMLLENLQRADLTIYEQAQGFQLMMDMGSSITDIVKDTGFSESTVRHRLKLNELDQELLEEKAAENIKIDDLIRIEKLKTQEHKNKALEFIGTNNFDWKLGSLLQEEKDAEFQEQVISIIPDGVTIFHGWNDPKYDSTQYINDLMFGGLDDIKNFSFEELDDPAILLSGSNVYLYVKREAVQQSEEEDRKEQERKKTIDTLEKLTEQMKKSREQFMETLPIKTAKEALPQIIKTLLSLLADSTCGADILNNWIGFESNAASYDDWESEQKERRKLIKDTASQYPEVMLAQLTYLEFSGINNAPYNYFFGTYRKSEELFEVYDYLKCLGYKMSDEEQQLLDGTHPAYAKEE